MREAKTIGVIPDGNRRYARKHGLSLQEGYMRGVDTIERFVKYVRDKTETKHVYIYTLSLENVLKRSKQELSFLFKIFRKQAEKLLRENPYEGRVRFIGRRNVLPKDLQKLMEKIERKTENSGDFEVILAVGYTGMAEIVDTVKSIAKKVAAGEMQPDDIDEETIYANLYAPDVPPPDFILRTSGEQRTSGFLPIQSVYSELIFYPKLWPELTEDDFEAIYAEYRQRVRRFGK
ncbi:MAG: di-trans,poly-cis-decaprenylcistransferase [Candidatus Diapherotrites archaeon]|nr:di-trans,poly-cis-decaprenylcistransferase [Candidatus Diapherotrites archaeon]